MLSFHPIANVFPLLEGKDFTALVDNIAATGLLEPVWLYEGMILDGRNRYRACEQVGLVCPTREYAGDDPVGFVLSMNLTRRHLDESQRAMVAARLLTMRGGRPAQTSQICEVSREVAATTLHVSPNLVTQARRVQDEGITELSQAVDTGEIAVSAAVPLTSLPREHQPAALIEARITAKNGKVTATITKAIVTRQEVLGTLQTALENGLSGSEAIKQALTVHAIALPTPGLADALARAVPEPVSIPATDGLYHVDMLTALKDGDSGAPVQPPHSCFSDTAHGVCAWFSLQSPLIGDFYAGESNHQIPAGLILSRQALHPVCPTVGAYAADATTDGSRLSGTHEEYIQYFVTYASEPCGSGNWPEDRPTSYPLPA